MRRIEIFRILFVQDMNPMGTGGGAQATDREFINFGIRQGHDIYILTPHEIGKTPVKDFELAILSNCVTFPKNELKKLTDNCRFMVYTHDYYICRFRLYFPSLPKCTKCRYMPFWKDIYARSKLNIFMSPLHWETHLGVMPELSKYPHAIVPSAINPKDHQAPMGIDVKPGTVIGVNNLFGFKGRENVLQYAQEHKELQFTLVGGKEKEVELPENCKYVGFKQREDLAKAFAEHEYLIHLPSTPQPCFFGTAKVLASKGWQAIRTIKPGDLVYTDKGRLRRVKETGKRRLVGSTVKIWLKLSSRKQFNEFSVTPEHPLLTAHGWVKAIDLQAGDHLVCLAGKCKNCGKAIHFSNIFCSHSCQTFYSQEHNLRQFIKTDIAELTLSDLELGRCAGLIDGEGSIHIRTGKRKGKGSIKHGDRCLPYPVLNVTNSDISILHYLKEITGFGEVRPSIDTTRSPIANKIYRWWLESLPEVYGFLKVLAPYLIVKKKQAELVLRTLDLRVAFKQGELSLKEFRSATENLRQAVCVLNKKSASNLKAREIVQTFPLSNYPITASESTSINFTNIGIRRLEIKNGNYKNRYVHNLAIEEDETYITEGIVAHNCERTPVEFLIANPKGKLIINQLVGIRSYAWFGKSKIQREEIIRHCEEAPKHFWREVNDCLK